MTRPRPTSEGTPSERPRKRPTGGTPTRPPKKAPDAGDLMVILLAGTLAALRDRLAADGLGDAAELVGDLTEIAHDYTERIGA